ncbi:hypothetical protein GE061_004467 [Apolygus lucorum]|uniref:Uncharacterized protein n=1 Tax=Apolygus lucorum TaxID=248454 RepID=A0A6A4IR89_APOLU|nr:hypothetical protein GE061_004467 [Apolygus lucorum]
MKAAVLLIAIVLVVSTQGNAAELANQSVSTLGTCSARFVFTELGGLLKGTVAELTKPAVLAAIMRVGRDCMKSPESCLMDILTNGSVLMKAVEHIYSLAKNTWTTIIQACPL